MVRIHICLHHQFPATHHTFKYNLFRDPPMLHLVMFSHSRLQSIHHIPHSYSSYFHSPFHLFPIHNHAPSGFHAKPNAPSIFSFTRSFHPCLSTSAKSIPASLSLLFQHSNIFLTLTHLCKHSETRYVFLLPHTCTSKHTPWHPLPFNSHPTTRSQSRLPHGRWLRRDGKWRSPL